jgi:hypothetical protein
MAKVLRYNFLFDSDKHSYKIECWQEGYSGTTTAKRLGAAPVMVRDKAEAGIMGTSLELSIEAEVNDELIDFYTVDSKKFLFREYVDNILQWQGYALPEKYSEAYIDAPYDVDVTASDGLGILKGVPFSYSGRYTILQIVKYILDNTELNLEFEVLCNIYVVGQASGDCVLNYVTVNADMWQDQSCYDVLSAIMTSFNAFITQKDNRWLIARYSDIFTESYIYNNTLNLINRRYLPIVELGSEKDAIPVGSLNLDILPAKKSCLFTFPYVKKDSWLLNYNFETDLSSWTYSSFVARIIYTELPYAKLPAINSKDSYIQQTLSVEESSDDFELTFNYLIGQVFDNGLKTGRLKILVSLIAGATTYNLSTTGWVTGSYSNYYIIEEQATLISWNKLKISDRNYSLIFSGLPASGTLIIKFIYDTDVLTTFVRIRSVGLNTYISKGLQINATMAEKASEEADDITVDFQDTPFATNRYKTLKNHFESSSGSIIWIENSTGKTDSFINSITRDYISHLAFPRRTLKGKLYSEFLSELLLYDTHADRYYILAEGTHDQLEEELDCELIEFLPYDDTLEIEDATDWTEGEESGSGGSSSGSGSSSGGSVDVSSLGSLIAGAEAKATPADTDSFGYSDSADSGKLKKFSWAQLKTAIANALNSVFASISHSHAFSSLTGKPTTISGYGITDAYTKTEVDNKVAAVYKYKGSVASYANLPSTGLTAGDVYNCTDTGMNYGWTGSAWDALGATYSAATQSTAGLMSSVDKTKLDASTSLNVADTIVKRDSSGKIAVTYLEVNGWTMTID